MRGVSAALIVSGCQGGDDKRAATTATTSTVSSSSSDTFGRIPSRVNLTRAGLRSGDVIVRLDDRQIEVVEHIFAELRQLKPGETAKLELKRNGQAKTVEVMLGALAR